jgi:hypothetical protein
MMLTIDDLGVCERKVLKRLVSFFVVAVCTDDGTMNWVLGCLDQCIPNEKALSDSVEVLVLDHHRTLSKGSIHQVVQPFLTFFN